MGNLELFIPELTVLLGAFAVFVLSVMGGTQRASWLLSVVMASAGVVATADATEYHRHVQLWWIATRVSLRVVLHGARQQRFALPVGEPVLRGL